MLPPVDISHFGKDQVRELAAHCRTLMEQKSQSSIKKLLSGKPPVRFNPRNSAFTGNDFLRVNSQFFMEFICHSVGVSSFRHRDRTVQVLFR
jgi:hypothetical protein